jgi:thymidine kinase
MADDGKIVIVAALDGTFQRKPFGPILDLIPYAERVSKLTSVCAVCGRDGSYTQRIVGGDQLLVIGGEEMYRPVCRACFNQTDKSKSHLIQQQKKK